MYPAYIAPTHIIIIVISISVIETAQRKTRPGSCAQTTTHIIHHPHNTITMQDFASLLPQKLKLLPFAISIPSALNSLNPIPHKYRAARRRTTRLRTHFPRVADGITRLQTSFNPLDTVRAVQRHRWAPLDLQYVALGLLALFTLFLAPAPPLLKMVGVMGATLLSLMPATRQFFWSGMTIWIYIMYFFCSR